MEAKAGQEGLLCARLCVLGSGSAANCTVLHTTWRIGDSERHSVCLIDLGFSPRATTRLLRQVGLDISMVDGVLLTHLDNDHCHAGWNSSGGSSILPGHAEIFVYRGHLKRGYARGLLGGRVLAFDGERSRGGTEFSVCRGVRASAMITLHDQLGAAAFHLRIGSGDDAPRLGYATDLGRVTDELVHHLSDRGPLGGVDVLVIESNYCPALQNASDRPEFLKKRVMGGRGHLSNHEALQAAEAICPREHVVLVHLSRQCNDRHVVAEMHSGADYTLTVSEQDRPTRWVPVRRSSRFQIVRRRGQLPLWS